MTICGNGMADCGGSIPRGGRPSLERAAQLETHILDVAWALFVDRGLAAVTVDAIAAKGRLSKRTIYDRFENKDALFVVALGRRIGLWVSHMVAPVPEPDFAAWVRSFCARSLRIFMTPDFEAVNRLVHGEGRRFPDLFTLHRDAAAAANDALVCVVRGEMARGTLDVEDPAFAAQCWMHILVGHAREQYDARSADFDPERHIARWSGPLTDTFLRIVGYRASS